MTTTELIRRYYETFNNGAREEMLALLAEDVAHDINQTGRETGKTAFRAFLASMDGSYAEQVEDLVILTNTDGTRAAAEFYIRGKYLKTAEGLPPATGQEYHLRVGAFFEVQNGQIHRVTNYYDLADWIRQVS